MTKKTAPAKKSAAKPAPKARPEIIQSLNVNAPGKTYPRDAVKYRAAVKALLKVLPSKGPGLTQSEMSAAMKQALPEFGSTAGWWMKTAQLDQEARGAVIRDGGKPLRWRKVK
jgi:hypothetical protein